MRIGCLQFAPQLGDVDNNLNRADGVLARANTDGLDLLVLPELAFSGYNFKSLQDISPFLEHSGSGITSLWARTVALKYNCVVTVGYPEKVESVSNSSTQSTGPEYYNSAIVVNADGETVANYRKSFLYNVDETWAEEGDQGFFNSFIPGLGNVSVGICMDINPYRFQAPWQAFEFAFHVLEVESNLVIVSMAWMTKDERPRYSSMPNEPDMETLSYWVTRLEPLIRSDSQHEIIVVFCNRCGFEDDATYAGTSAVIGILDGEVRVYGLLGRGEKELLVIDTKNSPYAKLVYRPDSGEGELRSPNFSASTEKEPEGSGKSSDIEEPVPSKAVHDSGFAVYEQKFRIESLASSVSVSPPLESRPKKAGPVTPPKKKVPEPLYLPKGPETKDLDNSVIPTPSAPSPIPQALRPRLIIPESPPISYSSVPNSAISTASFYSERSSNSVRSNESETSVSTVRSDLRPPEESTPYPDTPFSGYPSNSFSEGLAYNGNLKGGYSKPTSAFDDLSPVSARWLWESSDDNMPTPSINYAAITPVGTHATWNPGTPIGRKPEPFPWPAITNSVHSASRQLAIPPPSDEAVTPRVQRANSQSPPSNASSRQTNKTYMAPYSGSSTPPKRTVHKATGGEPRLSPPSSKSRNASRGRLHQKSSTSLGERTVNESISQYLDGISPRADSSTRNRSSSVARKPRREGSAKSRNSSRARPSKVDTARKQHDTIPIAVSPSILGEDGRSSSRAMSRGRHYQRSSSFGDSSYTHQERKSRSITPVPGKNIAQPSSRASTRERTPASRPNTTSGRGGSCAPKRDRSSSVDSTRAGRLHTSVRGRDQSTQTSQARPSSVQRFRRPSKEGMDRELREVASDPNLSIDSQNLSSTKAQTSAKPYRSFTKGSPERSPPSTDQNSITVTTVSQRDLPPNDMPPSALFDPETPKAMSFPKNVLDVELVPGKQSSTQNTTPTNNRSTESAEVQENGPQENLAQT